MRSSASDGERDLADMSAVLHQRARIRGPLQGEPGVDDRSDPAGLDQRPDVVLERPGYARLLLGRADPQCRSGQGQPLLHERREIHFRDGAVEERDLDDAP